MANITTMSLKAAPLQFATFTPIQYTPQVADSTLLAKSLTQQEVREKEARDNLSRIDGATNELRARLNSADHDWFSNMINEKQKVIDEQIDLGNFQTAIRLSKDFARDITRDNELQNRVLANQSYEKEKQKITSMSIDPLTKRRWEAENKYSYNGTSEWIASWTPVNDISLSSLQNLAAQMTAEDAHSSSTQSSSSSEVLLDANNKVTNDVTKAAASKSRSSSSSKSYSSHTKSTEDITKTFRNLLADSNISLALVQKFDNTVWGYNDALQRSTDTSLSEEERRKAALEANALKTQITDSNGIIITDYDTWLTKKVIPMFSNMSYHNTASSSGSGSGYSYSGLGGGGGSGLYGDNPVSPTNFITVSETATVKGSSVYSTPNNSGTPTYSADDYNNFFYPYYQPVNR